MLWVRVVRRADDCGLFVWMTNERPLPLASQPSWGQLPALLARQRPELEEPERLALVVPELELVQPVALLWRISSRQARSPCHRQHWRQQVPGLWVEEPPEVLKPARPQQVSEPQRVSVSSLLASA